LHLTLKYQDDIIRNITLQPTEQALPEIYPGYFEIPNEVFWKETSDFLDNYVPSDELDPSFVKLYSVELGSFRKELLNAEEFDKAYHLGSIIPSYFVSIDSQFLPLLPRTVSGILLESWFMEFEKIKNTVVPTGQTPLTLRIGNELHKYLRDRVRTDTLFSFVSALNSNNQADEIIFSSAFISQNRLILFYVIPPGTSGDAINDLRHNIHKFKKAYHLLSYRPLRLALLGEHRSVEFKHRNVSKSSLLPTIFYVLPRMSLSPGFFAIPKKLPGHFVLLEQLLGIIDELDDIEEFTEFLNFIDDMERKLPSPFNSWLDKFGAFRGSHSVLVDGAF
jgi:hypothetical protein